MMYLVSTFESKDQRYSAIPVSSEKLLPAKMKNMLTQTFISTIIDYGNMCYFDLTAVLLAQLDGLLNNGTRFIVNLRNMTTCEYKKDI